MSDKKIYTVRFVNPRRERWKWVFILIMALGTPLTSVALGSWFDYMFGMTFGIIGIIIGISVWLGLFWCFNKWSGEPATATIRPDSIMVVKQGMSESEEFFFSELIKYRVLNSFRGGASLRLTAKNGHKLILGGSASPEFTALIKEFDAVVIQYERLSRRSIIRIDMG